MRGFPANSRHGHTASCGDVDWRNRIESRGSPRALPDLLLRTLNWEVTEDGELTTWGFDDFELCEARENGLPDYEGGIVTHEFLRELANHLEAGKEIDIQTAGFTEVQGESPAVNGGDKSDTFMPLAPIGWHTGVPPPGHTSFADTASRRIVEVRPAYNPRIYVFRSIIRCRVLQYAPPTPHSPWFHKYCACWLPLAVSPLGRP